MSGKKVPKVATLDGFAEVFNTATGIDIKNLYREDRIEIITQNSTYKVTIVNPSKGLVDVNGSGDFFMRMTRAHISGSTFGGSLLKQGWITLDLLVEFNHGGKRIITSPVQQIIINGKPLIRSPSKEIN